MIKNRSLASRYASAFMEYCHRTIGFEKALIHLNKAKQLLVDNHELAKVLKSPEIAHKDKYSIIDKVFADEFSDEIRHFLKLLVDSRRIEFFYDIVEYARMKYMHEGMEEVLLKTSYPLELGLIKKIEDSLEKKFKKKFKFYIELDGRLLGGVQVVMGNTIIDGSVRKRLDELKEKIKTAEVI